MAFILYKWKLLKHDVYIFKVSCTKVQKIFSIIRNCQKAIDIHKTFPLLVDHFLANLIHFRHQTGKHSE